MGKRGKCAGGIRNEQKIQYLSKEIRAAHTSHDADLGDTYYQHWLRALEAMVTRKGAASAVELARCRDTWTEAALRTPHGSPIELQTQDLKGPAPLQGPALP